MYVITGGGSGIGRALAHTLALRNKKILIVGRRLDNLQETASFSPLISTYCTALDNEQGRKELLTYLADTPQIDGLVNNAGTVEPMTSLQEMKEVEWQQTVGINLNAPLFLTQSLLNKLEQGRVLNIGTGAAYFPIAGWAAYCISKAALSMLTRCWQVESTNTAFASVMPGIVDTHMQVLARQNDKMDADQVNFYKSLKADNRLLTPTVAALFLTWLLLDVEKSDFIAQEWDIYDTSHHSSWLTEPHRVPHWEK